MPEYEEALEVTVINKKNACNMPSLKGWLNKRLRKSYKPHLF
jgi:hypothetical protein